jgi:hypothetical protein
MLPVNLTAAHFTKYPPRAETVAVAHLALLRQLPLSFLPSLLRELIEYDYKFPAERTEIDRELSYLANLTSREIAEWFSAFSKLRLSSSQERSDWVNQPLEFTEQLSAYLWSTQQMDAFRDAATVYGNRLHAVIAPEPPSTRRLGIAVIGQGAASSNGLLFRHLREHGTYFNRINPDGGLDHLLSAVAARAHAYPVPYAHWYIDGGIRADHGSSLTCISYATLAPVREALLARIQKEVNTPGMGPEELRNYLARLSPGELGMNGDALLDRFQVKLLTEGSGTQIFSTTFAQWAAREVLRRASPLTLLVRFAPRQRQRPMSDLLSNSPSNLVLDYDGSLIDADMAAYYQWINQQRLPGSDQSSFLVWLEGRNQAVAIGPSLPRGSESKSSVDLRGLLSFATG